MQNASCFPSRKAYRGRLRNQALLCVSVWPEIKTAAGKIVKRCLERSSPLNVGTSITNIEEDGLVWAYHIFVLPAPADLPEADGLLRVHPAKVFRSSGPHKVYEATGTPPSPPSTL